MEKSKFLLFFTALLQIACVSINIYQVSHKHYVGAFIVGFILSLLWTFNIKGVVFGNWIDRLIYCTGAAVGTILGILISNFLYS